MHKLKTLIAIIWIKRFRSYTSQKPIYIKCTQTVLIQVHITDVGHASNCACLTSRWMLHIGGGWGDVKRFECLEKRYINVTNYYYYYYYYDAFRNVFWLNPHKHDLKLHIDLYKPPTSITKCFKLYSKTFSSIKINIEPQKKHKTQQMHRPLHCP